MPKLLPKRGIEIVMMVDRDAGVLDLQIFASHLKRREAQLVGSATLRIGDLRQVLPILTERLQIEDQLVKAEAIARKSKRRKTAEHASFNHRHDHSGAKVTSEG
jgi:hypothetical protein